jgi:1-acyl-sn-glycerol-3-phosphate acyltransferase
MQDWQLRPAHDIGLPLNQQLKSVRREGGLVNAITHLAWELFVTTYLKVFHRLSIEGREHLPADGPFILVANHASHLDSLVLASAVPWRLQERVFPVAAGDTFFSTPLTGTLSALLINALPMWRDRTCVHGLADLRERLTQEQCVYIVFPEGTRTRSGELGPFKAGIGMLVVASAVPVVPCRLFGTYEALPHDRRWPKPTKVRLKIGEPISFAEVPNDRQGWQSAAKRIEDAVVALAAETLRLPQSGGGPPQE